MAVFLRYLADLTPEHQKRWKLEEFVGDTFLHPDYARATCGQWPEKESIFNAFCEEMRIINEMTNKITGRQLFRKTYDRYNKPKKFGFLVRPTKEEYENFIQLCKGTISLLEEWLNKSVKFTDPKPKDEMIKIFKEIRNARCKPDHHVRDDNQYFVKQRETIKRAHEAIRTLRLIFANHPLAKTIEIPDWLYKGEIWTF